MSRLAVLLAVAVLPACTVLQVDAEVRETCATYHDVLVFAPIPGTAMSQTFTVQNVDAVQQLADLDAHVEFTRGTVTATSGITDFSFVQDASVGLASGDPSSQLPAVTVFACQGCGVPGPELDVTSATTVDAKAYVGASSLVVSIDLSGQLPPTDWTMDVDVCLTAHASYSYTP
jgi:hypothetical protein